MKPVHAFRLARVVFSIIAFSLAVYFLLTIADWSELGEMIRPLPWGWISVSLPALVTLAWLIRTWRWSLLLDSNNQTLKSFLRLHFSVGASIGLATITPGQSGEFFKVWLAKDDHDADIATVSGKHLFERILDVLVLASMTGAALIVSQGAGLLVVLGLGGGAVLVFATAMTFGARYGQFLPAFVQRLLDGLASLRQHPYRFVSVALVTLLGWLMNAFLWWVCFRFAGAGDISIAVLISILGLVTFASVLSFVPAGLGVSEASAASLLILHGIAPEQALVAALMLRVVSAFSVILGVIHWGARKTVPRLP